MTMKPRIQIFVACHKPTYVLDNRLLVPIQVGTASTEARYERMEYDNNGDNISAKNSQYCELTAQYSAGKIRKMIIMDSFIIADICHLRIYIQFVLMET